MSDEKAPIIVKKVVKGGHGHHGGAWKVAYADFVTAMMAFFLLMWLLNATEAESLSGLADYFSPTVGVQGKMGIGFRGGKGPISKGVGADISTNRGIVYGGVPSGPIVKVTEVFENSTGEPDAEKIVVFVSEKVEEAVPVDNDFVTNIKRGMELSNTGANVDLKQTAEGLEIQIYDGEDKAMFSPGTADLTKDMVGVFRKLAEIIEVLPNYLSIVGHTSSRLYSGNRGGYSNWDLAANRANEVRRTMTKAGLQSERILKIVARADNEPLNTANPESPVNDRVSIVLLRSAILPNHKRSAPNKLFLSTEDKGIESIVSDEKELIEIEGLPEEEDKESNGDILLEESDEIDKEIDRELIDAGKIDASKAVILPKNILDVKVKKKVKPKRKSPNAHLFDDKPDEIDAAIEKELNAEPNLKNLQRKFPDGLGLPPAGQ